MFRALMLLGGYALAYLAVDAAMTQAREQLTLESAGAAVLYAELRVDRLGPLKQGLEARQAFVDEVAAQTGFGVSLFIDDMRVATTASVPRVEERALGTEASEEVVETVLVAGEEFRGVTTTIGQQMLTAVRPLVDADGNRIGMVACYREWTQFVDDLAVVRGLLAGVLGFLFLCALTIGGRGASVRRLKAQLLRNSLHTQRLSVQKDELGELAWELELSKVEAERARDEAEQASQAKSAFLANMSHELRTPINAIMGYAEILAEDIDDEYSLEDLGRIQTSSQHLLGIISDILDLTKIESGHVELHRTWIDLRSLVARVQAEVQGPIDENKNELIVRLHPKPHEVFTDENKVSQILGNLLSNAAKFTENGTIRLRIKMQENGIEIIVRDTGIGMSAEAQERVFGRFVQGDGSSTKKYGGTGLGLTITRHLAELMGGSVMLTSELNEGTTFVVQLPMLHRLVTQQPASQSA